MFKRKAISFFLEFKPLPNSNQLLSTQARLIVSHAESSLDTQVKGKHVLDSLLYFTVTIQLLGSTVWLLPILIAPLRPRENMTSSPWMERRSFVLVPPPLEHSDPMKGNHYQLQYRREEKKKFNEIVPSEFDSPCSCRLLVTPFFKLVIIGLKRYFSTVQGPSTRTDETIHT